MPERPPHIQPQRVKAFIKDGVTWTLMDCAKCGKDFYATENQTKCEGCQKRRRKG
jgi:hypothetical protein